MPNSLSLSLFIFPSLSLSLSFPPLSPLSLFHSLSLSSFFLFFSLTLTALSHLLSHTLFLSFLVFLYLSLSLSISPPSLSFSHTHYLSHSLSLILFFPEVDMKPFLVDEVRFYLRYFWIIIWKGSLVPKSFDYQFMATLDCREQGIQNDGYNKKGGERDTTITRIIT